MESELTFKELTENLAFVKITYNNKVIYDDYSYLLDDDVENDGETLEHLNQVIEDYANKKIYKMLIEVVEFHHCLLTIEGEE